ncbi:MAG TPA: OmpA family protein [Sandaracinaceae bacterium LLY-WYZ-13_1]|nr:OmpA family protein [Sandaracinaceae bacterium LLY-WYZ-13_1]
MLRLLRRRAPVALTVVMVIAACAGSASAQDRRRFEVQLFLPPAAGGSTFTIDRPSTPRHLNAVFGLGASYALEPFVRGEVTDDTGAVVLEGAPVVRHLLQVEAMAALGLFEFVELGVVVPFAVTNRMIGDPAREAVYDYDTGVGMSDLRLSAKVPILRGDFALAARFVAQIPNGDWEQFLGMEYWVATPSVVAAWDPGPLTIAGELGYRLRQRRALPGYEQDDAIALQLGVNVPIIEEIEIIGESHLRIGVGGRTLEANEVPFEVDAGLRFRPVSGLSIEVGAGTGVAAGVGAPAFRAFTALRFATEQDDACTAGPEDFDGFEDGDFCADLDNDADGIVDSADECPNDPEDEDRFLDDDGCPDTDNDADGVVDGEDSCPTQSEDRDGFQDEDGCPEPDNDQDGVADGLDECPMEPEDQDRYQDEDGCPEPGPEAASVTVTDTRILISERIYFDFDRDTIRPVSRPLLDQVADVIDDLPRHLRIRVDGYSDDQGLRAYNLDLSYRRARAVVEYLVSQGVDRSRLEYRGYGPENPVAPNDTPEGRALNRRVEFTILQEGESAGGRRRRD